MNNHEFIFLTPYESSVIDLMQDRNNHRLLIDHWFSKKEIPFNYSYWFKFYLLSQKTRNVFLYELSDEDFLYLLTRLNKFYKFDVHDDGIYMYHLYRHVFLEAFRIFDENGLKWIIVHKSLKILLRNHHIASENQKKMLWWIAVNYFHETFYYLNDNIHYFYDSIAHFKQLDFSLKEWLSFFKREAKMLKSQDLLDLRHNKFIHKNNQNKYIFYHAFAYLAESYLNKYGMKSLPKLKKRLEHFCLLLGVKDYNLQEIFVFVMKNKSLTDCVYFKSLNDLDVFLKEIYGFSLNELDNNDFNFNKNTDYLVQSLPHLFFENDTLFNIKKFSDWIKVYGRLCVHSLRWHPAYKHSFDKDLYYKKYVCRFLEGKGNFVLFLAFHYLCYFEPDDFFNESNPYCLDKESVKEFIKKYLFVNDSYDINNYDIESKKSFFKLFFEDFDEEIQMMIKNIQNNNAREILIAYYYADKDDVFIEKNLANNHNLFTYEECFSKKYHPTMAKCFFEKIEQNKEFHKLFEKHLFKYKEYQKDFLDYFSRWDATSFGFEYESSNSNILDWILQFNTSYNDLNFNFCDDDNRKKTEVLAKLFDFNEENIKLFKEYMFDGYITLHRKTNDFLDIKRKYHFLPHLWVAMKFDEVNKPFPEFDVIENYIIEQLKHPIELNYDAYLLKEELLLIED